MTVPACRQRVRCLQCRAMRAAQLLLSGLCLLGALSLPARAEIVKLRDGTLLHGEITAFDEATGLSLRRVDTGGEVSLRWEHLPPEEVARLKAARGFTGDEVQPFMVNVVTLVLRNGTTESGVLVEGARPDAYTLKRRSGTDSFPRQYVRSVEPGKADAQSVYPADELYGVIRAQLGDPADAAANFAMAVACEGAGLYEQARTHYEAARLLDPKLKPDLIPLRIERLGVKIENRAETAELDEIRNRLFRKEYDSALESAAGFRKTYPQSRQLGELTALESQIGRERQGHYAARIISDYFSFLGKTIGELSRKDGLTVGSAEELLAESVHGEIVARLADSYHMTPEGIEALWKERVGGSVRTAGYGTGTFILGAERALNWIGDGDEAATPEAAAKPVDDDLQKRIDDALKKRDDEAKKRAAQSAAAKVLDEGITPDEWWAAASTDDRTRWLTAYYAEFGQHLMVVRAKPRPCRQCNSAGTIPGQNEKGELVQLTCTICKGLKFERLVDFR
jgi:hypothetical protein